MRSARRPNFFKILHGVDDPEKSPGNTKSCKLRLGARNGSAAGAFRVQAGVDACRHAKKGSCMQRGSFAVRTGLRLTRTPSHREQIARRRVVAIVAMLALAVASATFGAMNASNADADRNTAQVGPFSYLTE